MRIAWFTHRYYPCLGGAENYGRRMVERFTAAGHGADVFTSDAYDLWYFINGRRKKLDAPRVEEVDGARVERFPVRHFVGQRYVGRALSYIPNWHVRCRVASYMPILPGIGRVRGEYDAVYGVGFPYTTFSHAAWRCARACGAPLILTPFLHLATPGDKVNRTYTQPHQIRLLNEADCVVVQTTIEANAVESWGIPAERILVLGMAVDHAAVTGGDRAGLRRELGIAPDAPAVGQLGTCDPNKGTNDLVRAVARMNAERPVDQPVHLMLGGNSSPEFEAFAAGLPAECGRWLHRLGPLAGRRIADFYAALDVFSMPSRTDSFGIVYLEAWANGLPVVAARAGGVAEVITHGKNGVLIEFGDVGALAGSLGGLLGDRVEARRLGDAGREHVARGFTWDDRYRTLIERTGELLAGRRGSGRGSRNGVKGRSGSVRV